MITKKCNQAENTDECRLSGEDIWYMIVGALFVIATFSITSYFAY